ncbi:YceI family protein [uncultured Microbacterium sp.]|uniref:YceI family protein n=1 Tax=uncultured Microbacterium sp. TaxID=191216 RepID=UPI002606EE86|nr:YceI family protein [uncultured Microbacterium sp.]
MKKRTLITLVIAGTIVVAIGAAAFAGPYIYRDYLVAPAAAEPTLSASASTAGPVSSDELQGDWTVGDGSYAGYRVDEVLNDIDTTVTGRTDEVTGSLTVADATLTAARIEVDVASIATDSGSRDSYFRGTAMRTGKFPTATFVLTSPVKASAMPVTGQPQKVSAAGDLTLAGVTRSVSVELDAVFDGERGQVVGRIPITFADFAVEAPDLGFVKVEDDGFVEFSLTLEKS